MSFALHALQIIGAKVTTGVTTRAIVVVPCLRRHLNRDKETGQSHNTRQRHQLLLEPFLQKFVDGSYTEAYPNGKSIERADVGIVALTWLERRLVEINHDGQSRHEEQQRDNPQLPTALTSVSPLPEDAQHTEYQRQTIKDITSLILCQV